MCNHVEPWASSFNLRCSSVLSYINAYLAIDSGASLRTNSFRALIAAWLSCFQRNRDEITLIEHVCRGGGGGVKCKVIWAVWSGYCAI